MSRQSSRAQGRARVAVVGAGTEDGIRLREALAARGVPGTRVDLFGTGTGEVQIGDYAGEARLIQEPDLEEIAGYDVIFLCERGALGREIAGAVGSGTLIIDLEDALPERLHPPRVHLEINPEVARGAGAGCFSVPHPLSLLLVELLHPLDRKLELVEATAVVLQPASDFGKRGVEELRRQTVQLLNFAEASVDVFGRQLAFNVIPGERLPGDLGGVEARVGREVGELLGWDRNRLSLRRIAAPIFYGHGLQLRVRLGRECGVKQVHDTLSEAGIAGPDGSEVPATPMEVTGETCTNLASVTEDGLAGFWLWVVAGEAASKGTDQALRLAERLGDL